MPNRLQHETSPYLLQHANNPVDWYPWGDEAFEKAREENKPVLVSIGYAACHWCHVMEHESFEDPDVAEFMNKHFVCIKVDREEHPDVDHLYMDALQAMTGSGGWPLNMFTTPDRKPFYGGTYFPPRSMYGRSSWPELLQALHRAWHEKPEEIKLQSEQMLQHLQQASIVATATEGKFTITREQVNTITLNLLQQADEVFGGFGAAPKFPNTGAIGFLLEYYHFNTKQNDDLAKEALQHALLTLDSMIAGGIYDQIGGGFARYATDNEWLVPHFEKMLYDNALLVSVLSDAYRLTRKERYKDVIESTIAFCKRELGFLEAKGFYCALDADSEEEEGKYYTWSREEWQEVFGNDLPAVSAYFGVSVHGNWEGTNILHEAIPTASILQQYSLTEERWKEILQQASQKLWKKRQERIRPATDDKMLLSWNALMNMALTDAGLALENEEYLSDAKQHMDWMLQTFRREDGLKHVCKGTQVRIAAKLDDYAYLIKALCKLASAIADEQYIIVAEELMEQAATHFLHEDKNFYYYSSDQQTDILVRKIELYDSATPSANAIMLENLWNMAQLTENAGWLEQCESMLSSMLSAVLRYPTSFACWAILCQRYEAGMKQLTISGPDARLYLKQWQALYYPEIITMATDRQQSSLASLKGKYSPGQTLLYLCEQFSCKAPVTTPEEIRALLRS